MINTRKSTRTLPAPPQQGSMDYYLSLLTSEYKSAQATKLTAWLKANIQVFQDALQCALSFPTAYSLGKAVGVQLDVLGQVVGVSRILNFQPTYTPGSSVSFSYRRMITIDHTKCGDTDSPNFPVLIAGTFPWLATTSGGGGVQSPQGYDIIFTTDIGGTQTLPYERVGWNGATGKSEFWVQVPNLSASQDTIIYVLYGSAGVDRDLSNRHGVWDSHYRGVWHFGDGTTLDLTDSTSNGNNGTNHGAAAAAGLSYAGMGSLAMNVSYVSIGAPASLNLTSAMTIEAVVHPSSNPQFGETYKAIGKGTAIGWSLSVVGPGSGIAACFAWQAGSSVVPTASGGLRPNLDTNLAVTYDGNIASLYINNNASGVNSRVVGPGAIPDNISVPMNFGVSYDVKTGYWSGQIDEVRISDIARSPSYLTSVYNNQYAGGFYTISGATNISSTIILDSKLDDDTYRILLQATVLKNHWNGTITDLRAKWQQLFPGSLLLIHDNQDMSVNFYVAAPMTPLVKELILHDLIIPRPQGVQYTIEFATLPLLGWDRRDPYVAGWDEGHWP